MSLKRLFIGLLILSALTAEGTAFFNIALTPFEEYIFELRGAENKFDAQAAYPQEGDKLFSPVQFGICAFFPLVEAFQPHGTGLGAFCAFDSQILTDTGPGSKAPAPQTAPARLIAITLNGSDNSPPVL